MTTETTFLPYFQEPVKLDPDDRPYPRHHVFETVDVDAVNAALASGRPLLLRGKPGTGKSQLALAAAVGLKRALVSHVIDARAESRDLLYRFDAVRRLADAQVLNATPARFASRRKWLGDEVKDPDLLHEQFYIEPGPLWWALNWKSAAEQAEKAGLTPPVTQGDPKNGVVVLSLIHI